MSKLSIRPRNLDACKFIPIYKCEEIPDLNDYASINRSIPQLPTGMEKEEESEHHLQQAISAQQAKGTTGELVIPTPEVFNAPEAFYNELYPLNYKLPRQLIHVQPFAIEHDIPDYDMDSDDELWLEQQKDYIGLTHFKFEEIMDRLEKSSSQHVITLKEAKMLLKEEDDLIITVFDYWLNKRLRTQMPLIPQVKTERRDLAAVNSNNPYIAFRRRTEKMQTRKNRKNDEISYEKMLKLRRDLRRAMNLLQLVKQREKTKLDQVKLTAEIFEKRYHIGDFSGNILNELNAQRLQRQQQNLAHNVLKANENKPPRIRDDSQPTKKKREYKRRPRSEHRVSEHPDAVLDPTPFSDEEGLQERVSQPQSDHEEDDSDGPFAFKRKKGCQYYAPLNDPFGNWPFYSAEEKAKYAERYRFYLTELKRNNPRYLTFARKRIGRGGRIIFDRICSPLTLNSQDPVADLQSSDEDLRSRMSELQHLLKEREYFRTKSPPNDSISDETISPYEKEQHAVVDEYGNPIIPINLNDYLNERDYDDDDDQLDSSFHRIDSDPNLVKFKNHQEELFEMQKQMQLRQNQFNNSSCLANLTLEENHIDRNKTVLEDSDCLTKLDSSFASLTPNSTSGLGFIKQENAGNHRNLFNSIGVNSIGSSLSAATSVGGVLTSVTSQASSLPQSSILDPQSVQKAVSALHSSHSSAQTVAYHFSSSIDPAIAATAVTNTTPKQLDGSSVGSCSNNNANINNNNGPAPLQPYEQWQSNADLDGKCKLKLSGGQNSHSTVESKLAPTDVT